LGYKGVGVFGWWQKIGLRGWAWFSIRAKG
jgi:hypothetical protein